MPEVLPYDKRVAAPLVVQSRTGEMPRYTSGYFMHGLHSRNIEKTDARLPCSKAEVKVLSVHEEVLIKETYLLEHAASYQQDTATEEWDFSVLI